MICLPPRQSEKEIGITKQDLVADAVHNFHLRGPSIKEPNFWKSEPTSARSTLAMVALCSGEVKLYSDTSSSTPSQLVIEPQLLEW